jgi:hypothetical protein
MLGMGVLLVWLLLGVGAAFAVAWWARRLWARREELSLGAKAVAVFVAATLLAAALGTVVGLAKAFSAVDGETVDPSAKARVVAEGISGAMNFTALGIAIALPGAVILGLMTRKRGQRLS